MKVISQHGKRFQIQRKPSHLYPFANTQLNLPQTPSQVAYKTPWGKSTLHRSSRRHISDAVATIRCAIGRLKRSHLKVVRSGSVEAIIVLTDALTRSRLSAFVLENKALTRSRCDSPLELPVGSRRRRDDTIILRVMSIHATSWERVG